MYTLIMTRILRGGAGGWRWIREQMISAIFSDYPRPRRHFCWFHAVL